MNFVSCSEWPASAGPAHLKLVEPHWPTGRAWTINSNPPIDFCWDCVKPINNMVLHIKMHKVHIYAIDICQKYKIKISRKLWIKEKSAALTVLQQLVHKGWIVRVIEDTFWRLCSPEMFLFNDPSKYLGSICNHTFRIPSPSFFVIRQDFWSSDLEIPLKFNTWLNF